MLGVLTYLFYLLSKPNTPIKQICAAKVQLFFDIRKCFVYLDVKYEHLPLQQHLTTLTAKHYVEALLEVVEVEAVSNHWTQVQSTQQHLLHLIPCFPHAATCDTFDSQCIEDDV